MKHPDLLDRYLALVSAAPVGVTSLDEPGAARRVLVDDALSALPLVFELAPGTAVDVGSGGGSPGIPLAVETGVRFALLESRERKAAFLRSAIAELGLSAEVIQARSEDAARGEYRDAFDLATARALAAPPVAVELSLPLVAVGGSLVLWSAAVDVSPLERAAREMGGALGEVRSIAANRQLVVIRKQIPTPERFPRRPGVAQKRPLA